MHGCIRPVDNSGYSQNYQFLSVHCASKQWPILELRDFACYARTFWVPAVHYNFCEFCSLNPKSFGAVTVNLRFNCNEINQHVDFPRYFKQMVRKETPINTRKSDNSWWTWETYILYEKCLKSTIFSFSKRQISIKIEFCCRSSSLSVVSSQDVAFKALH